MKLIINYNENGFYINLDNGNWVDDYIAEQLGFTLKNYQKILKRYNAFCSFYYDNDNSYFKLREDAEKALEILEPYLILAELIK